MTSPTSTLHNRELSDAVSGAVCQASPTPFSRITDDQALRFKLHAGQWRAWQSKARFIAVIAGTQSGKTSFGPTWLMREIDRCGEGDYLAVTASYDLFKLKMQPALLDLFVHRTNWGEWQASLGVIQSRTDKSRIILRSANAPGGLESGTVKAAWLDECGQDGFTIDAWQAVQRRLSLAQGRALLTTTPYNLGWLYSDVYARAKGGDATYDLVQFRSIDNPVFPRAEYERARAVLPPWKFAMFYEGEFSRPAGMIYADYDEIKHCVPAFSISPAWPRHVGVDFGGTEHTALVWLAQEPATDRYFAYREALGGGYSGAEHARMALEYREPVMTWRGGAHSEDNSRMTWRMAGVPVAEPMLKEVEAGIDRVVGLFRQDRLLVLDHMTGLRGELATYSREVDAAGEPTHKIADKERFHRLDALRYACSGFSLAARPAHVDAADIAEERARERDLAERWRKHEKAWRRFKRPAPVQTGTGW